MNDNDNFLKVFESGDLEDSSVQTGAINGNFPADVMQQIPCMIGFTYTRFEVDGSVKACCVSPFPLGNINEKDFEEIWHSAEYNVWRSKFLNIHKKKFHLHDAEFSFCQICPHIPINKSSAKNLSEKFDQSDEINLKAKNS